MIFLQPLPFMQTAGAIGRPRTPDPDDFVRVRVAYDTAANAARTTPWASRAAAIRLRRTDFPMLLGITARFKEYDVELQVEVRVQDRSFHLFDDAAPISVLFTSRAIYDMDPAQYRREGAG